MSRFCLIVALAWLVGCGGSGPAAKPRVNAGPAGAASEPGPGPGWTTADGPSFRAWMPEGFRRDDAQHRFTAEHNGTTYAISWATAPDGVDPDLTLDSTSQAFFRACHGARLRTRRDDTLEHRTVTVDGTCAPNSPVLGQVHLRGRDVIELYAVVSREETMDQDDLRGFFHALRVKSQ